MARPGRKVGNKFFAAVLRGIGAPVNKNTLRLMRAWQSGEGTEATWNPFATTTTRSGSTNFNDLGSGVGVQNFRSFQDGVSATIQTIKNGHYPGILQSLQKNKPAKYIATNFDDEWSTWGTGHLVADRLGAVSSGKVPQTTTQTTTVPSQGTPAQDITNPLVDYRSIMAKVDASRDAFINQSRSNYFNAQKGIAPDPLAVLKVFKNYSDSLGEARAAMYGGTTKPPVSSTISPDDVTPGNTSDVTKILRAAKSQLGKPYVWGAESPQQGFDCSGLIDWAFRQAGYDYPGRLTTYSMAKMGKAVNVKNIKPGDWIITNGGKHVVLYAGDGKVLAAPHSGEVVQYQPLSRFKGDIVSIRRVLPKRAYINKVGRNI